MARGKRRATSPGKPKPDRSFLGNKKAAKDITKPPGTTNMRGSFTFDSAERGD
jgi:hypothetical protein